MSDVSKRGKDFELKVAKILRAKIDRSAKRNAGSHANWNRRSDVFTNLPYHFECKDHETLKPKEWFRQADDASFGKTPVLVFPMDTETMAIIRFEDLTNLMVEIADQKLEIQDLRQPIELITKELKEINKEVSEIEKIAANIESLGNKIMDGNLKPIKFCKNNHIISEGRETCMTKGCQYSATYIKPKTKK